MFSSPAQIVTISLDVLLSLVVCAVFSRSGVRKQYPWMFTYFCVRAIAGALIEFLLYGPLLSTPETYTKIYFVVWWANYLVSTSLLFLGCLDAYRQALVPLPGLARMGTPVFRWAALASALVTATTLTSIAIGPGMILKIGIQMMRCIGTAELCLVALLLLVSKAIGLSSRNRAFGVSLGLGLMSAITCAQAATAYMKIASSPALQGVFDAATLATLALWTVYGLRREPERKQITVRADSAVYKWDQIASALGHKGTQVALQPTPSFFLVDVEKVVERAFSRTLNSKESESQ